MSMEPNPAHDPPAGRRPMMAAVRWMLTVPLPPRGTRLIDMIVIFAGIPVAMILCIPIIVVTVLTAIPGGVALARLGVPEAVSTVYGLGYFVGSLAVAFVVLVAVYRRLPSTVRGLIAPDDELADTTTATFDADVSADPSTLDRRLAAADAALGPRATDADADAEGALRG
jgi:hypothetical protein